MTTYKVLLVDDEEEVRNAIEQRINWEELGFEDNQEKHRMV